MVQDQMKTINGNKIEVLEKAKVETRPNKECQIETDDITPTKVEKVGPFAMIGK